MIQSYYKRYKTVRDYYQCDTKYYQSLKFGHGGAGAVTTFQLLQKSYLCKSSLVSGNMYTVSFGGDKNCGNGCTTQ